ncbi:MAG: Efflux transporter, RND family, MFP subunit [Candidatus Beckwithbacteria bacterium GW2011_GWB1_47_15]|uniref:Efflux transporter, RND family, MFP subunit n=1 Tax=Candidatus Beckwithbacteria bacterium GW2011_GWB1_47_15 TaxID=1618371 RepID=A0A0G1U4U3_9BACT|nr:MAG: secretion protein HlyD, macrolide-specific efflux protein MacA [Candidatus Beckwithbacteria bacterium GW2011_GWC1_49_16]KKU34943.1 MAG: Efflux transporter, RND family, MFP subunit [Candidatus Beckwithbacteria bacterium GW2011_GWA1_46_30]KKU61348.1 MAG: Efflux transporter, RND family, MFP subunit [Candidatus Beckwithbacteria bacterium GW2011_GWB1_47_15]KKU71381.1 MAG: Efflux transporter, RND family, MFP subunit [Candidatus Beckwithbacteria bacterium GW2011_GWA2_47_25]OGD48703.1 MAG: hypo
MFKFLQNLNTKINLVSSLSKKAKSLTVWLKKRKLLTLFLAVFLGLGGFFSWQRLRPKSPQELYRLATVNRGNLTQTVAASGVVKSETQVDLKFQTSGQLAWVGVRVGDRVQKWQALASLDQRQLKKQLAQELIDYSKERNDFEEDRRVTYQDTLVTDTLKRVLAKNQWDLERAVLDVEISDLAVKLSTIVSPIAGVVTHIDVPVPGVNITPATAVFTVADPDHLVFEAEIDETDIGQVKQDQKAILTLDAFPDEPVYLTVDSIDFASSLDSSGSTVYLAKLNLLNSPDSKFRLGLNGEVVITTAEKEDVLTIPFLSLIEDDNQTSVKLVEKGQVITQPVTVGIQGDEQVEITSGLKPGQTIVVAPK